MEAKIDEVYLDGAYDAQTCYDGLLERDLYPIIPPPRNAINWYWEEPGDADDYPRNQFIDRIEEIGRAEWKKKLAIIDEAYQRQPCSDIRAASEASIIPDH